VGQGCSSTLLGERMPVGGYRAKQLFAGSTIFSAGGHPL